MRPYGWGFVQIQINQDLLASGRFALSHASGLFEDGISFSMPGQTDLPMPLEIPEQARDMLVHLVIPIRQPGAMEMIVAGREDGRYRVSPFEAFDTQSGSPQPAEIDVGRLNVSLRLDSSDREDFSACLSPGSGRFSPAGRWCSILSGFHPS